MDNALEQIIPAIRMMLHPAGLVGLRLTGAEPPAEVEGVLRVDTADLAAVNEAIVWYRTHNGGTPHVICIKGLGTLSATDAPEAGRMRGRVAVVTGAAQGFGEGIARGLAAEGAYIVVADLNEEAGRATAASLNAAVAGRVEYAASLGATKTVGGNRAIFVRADVADTASLDNLIRQTVSEFGGIDLFVSNAGVLRAGGLDTMTPEAFDFVTRVNYNAYFYCVRAVAPVMKLQNEWSAENYGDVVQINSKSGLRGSKANFAYAGGKFGGVGLTQSFALELAPHRIKVNSVCPGNYYEGPLWSDPENGLFVQYLAAGKVPGAKTVDDVRRHYMAQVPMGKGTAPEDVVRAILYLVEQTCETGQALPVTGGQVMLS
jgi:NAD(P)-dependent dehydrogenase (short-subunit alcohol dehydrogenase family)